jgi:hypothetical protein
VSEVTFHESGDTFFSYAVMALEWEIHITFHSDLNPLTDKPNIYFFTHLLQDSSQTVELSVQFAQESSGSTMLSSHDAKQLGWTAEIHSNRAVVFHWEPYHYHALKDLFCNLGYSADKVADFPLTQLADECLVDSIARLTSNFTSS